MLRRLLGRLLRSIAATIRRWADLVLGEPLAPSGETDVTPVAHRSPPRHWLERVRRDAPELLAPATEEGAAPQAVASPPEPVKLRTGRVPPRVSAPRVPSDPASGARAPEEHAPASGRPSRGRVVVPDAGEGVATPAPSSPAHVDVPLGPTRTGATGTTDPLAGVPPQRRSAAETIRTELPPEAPRGEPTRPTPPRRIVATPPELLDDEEEEAEADVDQPGSAPPPAPHGTSVAAPRAEIALSVDRKPRAPVATTKAFGRQSPTRPRAPFVAARERAASERVPREVARDWPSHAPDRPDITPPTEVLESRWPELPPDAPSHSPDWTAALSALRRARSLEREQRGEG